MSQHDKPSNQRLDAQMQVLAIAEGLGIPHPMSWTWLEPGQLKLICQAIAKQAAQAERLRAALNGLRSYVEEVWAQHRDPHYQNEPMYNECEKDECMWCSETRKFLEAAPRDETVTAGTETSACAHAVGDYTCPICGTEVRAGHETKAEQR